jgi:transketolase
MNVADSTVASPPTTDGSAMQAASHTDMANAIRALAMDAVQQANSGHPGMPMGMADVATVLFTQFLKFDAADPHWPDRDRFVLSAGHGSMLLYALLHLTGYSDMTIEQLKRFRQLGSITAGHPEYGHAAGIETTTGPLGQGLANAVGMALAERLLAERFGKKIVDHFTYALAGDGCLMEGVGQEAITLAGHLGLGRLIVLFDDNSISIDGPTSLSTSENHAKRFAAAGWHVQSIDGHDPMAIASALARARKATTRPSLIACKTVIGFGAPTKAGTAATHGSPLGKDEVAGAREKLGWAHAPFDVPANILQAWRTAGSRGASVRAAWQRRQGKLAAEDRAELDRRLRGELPSTLGPALAAFKEKLCAEKPAWATRKSSQEVLEVINPLLPEMLGGSADLTGSNNTKTATLKPVTRDSAGGRYVYYGIREHAMAAAMNGIALHGGFIPYGGTFLVFSDYCRPAIRLAALMGERVIHVMTHDSIGLGEDGPTHQPVEQLAALRAIPNLNVYRPADAVETAECWELALRSARTPSVIALSRQNLAAMRTTPESENLSARGAYVLAAANAGAARVTLIATGSEVEIARKASELLEAEGIGTTLVSMPCMDLFAVQDSDYQDRVIDPRTVRIAVEAGIAQGWDRWVGREGAVVGMHGFGASAPYQDLYKHFGITAEEVAKAAKVRL